MDPGVPQDALIQVSHALCRCIPRLGLQHLPTPQDVEDSEDTSRSQQLQAPLIVGSTVLLVCVHHGHVVCAGLISGQELILRGREGQMLLRLQASAAGSPCPGWLRHWDHSGPLVALRAPALPPCMWLHTMQPGSGGLG